MEKTVVASFNLRGTEEEIKVIKARIAAISACEEVISMRIKERKKENG